MLVEEGLGDEGTTEAEALELGDGATVVTVLGDAEGGVLGALDTDGDGVVSEVCLMYLLEQMEKFSMRCETTSSE